MTGFYFLLGLPGDGWKMLVAGLLGFIIARLARRFLPALCTRFCLVFGTPVSHRRRNQHGGTTMHFSPDHSSSGSTAF